MVERVWRGKLLAVLAVLVIGLLGQEAFATNYYVSRNGNNSGGTSWSTAWSEFDQINWGSVRPGDTVYIDGGSSGMSYNTKLVTASNGTSSAMVNVKRSTESGHNGTVTCNAQIKVWSSYVNFDGGDNSKFLVPAVDSMCVFFVGYWSSDASGSIISNVTLNQNYGSEWGVSMMVYSNNTTIRGCKFIKSAGEDQLGVTASGNVTVDGCEFTGQLDSGTTVHRDVLSVYPGTAPGYKLTVKNSYIHDSQTDSIIVIPNAGATLGSFEFYNNIWWNVDTCVKFDASRISSIQDAYVHDNKYGNESVWIAVNAPMSNQRFVNNVQITSAPSWNGSTGGGTTPPPTPQPTPVPSPTPGPTPAPTPLPTGGDLVAAYSFDEASGSTVADASGKGNTGTITNAVRTTSGRFGGALTFNGSNSWVTVPNSSSLGITGAVTVEAWVCPTANAGWRTMLTKENGGCGSFYLYAGSSSGNPAAAVYAGGEQTVYGSGALALNAWSHLAMTYDGAQERVYINGVQVGSRAQTGAISSSTGAMRIGGNSVYGEYFNGRIDEVRVYSKALTAAQVVADMNAAIGNVTNPVPTPSPTPVPTPAPTNGGLVAAYRFDEGTGLTTKDASGNNNTGTIYSALWTTGRYGTGLSFNGSSNWVTVNNSPSLNMTTGLTLEAWVKPATTMSGWKTIMQKEMGGGGAYSLSANSGQNTPAFGITISGKEQMAYFTKPLPANTWTHIASTYTGATQRLFVNGVLVATRAQTGAIPYSSGALHIGANEVWGEHFSGVLDEIRIYNRPLTSAEIQADYTTAIK